MPDKPTDAEVATALAFMKQAARETFKLSARMAESMAGDLEKTGIIMSAPTALRLLAIGLDFAATRD